MAYALLIAWVLTRLYDAVNNTYLKPWVQRTSGAFDDQILPLMRRGLIAIVWVLAVIIGLNNAGYDVGTAVAGPWDHAAWPWRWLHRTPIGNIFGGITLSPRSRFSSAT